MKSSDPRPTQQNLSDDLRGKTAMVTGPLSGFGRHSSLTPSRAGCKVAFAGRSIDQGKLLLSQIHAVEATVKW
jgi:NADP-dependent 3-hydroxy acid dehydrogenase YdfG